MSLFRDFLIGINQIDYEETENRSPETLGYMLHYSRRKKSKKVRIT